MDLKRNIENSSQPDESSSDSDYVEVESKGGQSEILELNGTSSHSKPIISKNSSELVSQNITNLCNENQTVFVETNKNNFLEKIIIDDQQKNYIENSSSFNVSVEGSQQSLDEDQNSQRSFNPMVPSRTMVFSNRTSPGEDILEQSASNEEMKNNQNQNSSQNEGNQTNACFNPDQLKNKRECPNYTICKGLGNKDSNKKKHWVIDNCPKNCIENKETLAKFDQNSEIIIYSSSDENSINNESSNNQSMISNKTDNSEIKEIYAKSQIPRTKSFCFKNKVKNIMKLINVPCLPNQFTKNSVYLG